MTRSDESDFVPLFNGVDLDGWTAIPREYGTMWMDGPRVIDYLPNFPADYQARADAHPAAWTVEGDAVIGRQDPPGSGYGGYLLSDDDFGDFELVIEAKPDWPADTGIMIRRRPDSWEGLQVLIDHRRSGSIGGFYGNGIGAFQAVPFTVDAVPGSDGRAAGLRADDPTTSFEPFTADKRTLLSKAASLDEFLSVWRWDDWNEFRIRCVGEIPVVTVWINGLLVSQIDMSRLRADHYDPATSWSRLGETGRIALEVHDNDPAPGLGIERWAPDAACRWRNAQIRALSPGTPVADAH